MSRSPHYPMYWSTWGTCGTCGFSVPSRYIVMSRKHGWQCLPGSGRTRGCYDGDYDRDDIYFVYPDNEGTRDTAAPLADQGQPYIGFTIYVFTDTATGKLYSVDFASTALTLTLVSGVDVNTQNGPFDWLELTTGARLYVSNGTFQTGTFSTVYCPSAPGANQTIPTFTSFPNSVEPPVVIDIQCPVAALNGLGADFTMMPPTGTTVTNYHWAFGDGNATDTGATNTVHHDYSGGGTYGVVVTLTLSNGASINTGSCPVTVSAATCPVISLADFVITSSSLSANASFTRVGAVAELVRSPGAAATDSVTIQFTVNSALWGTCTRLHYRVDTQATVSSLGGIPEATVGVGAFLTDQIGTGTKNEFAAATYTAPFSGTLTIGFGLNGNMSGHARATLTIFELEP